MMMNDVKKLITDHGEISMYIKMATEQKSFQGQRIPWRDAEHPDELGWTMSFAVRPMSRRHHPGKVDYMYYSPDNERFNSLKKARAYMDGAGVQRITKTPGGGTHIRWTYYR
jgi:hypothetical protein